MTLGKIRIKDKVYFEPDGLEKPKSLINKGSFIAARKYCLAMKEYEASKQLIEVNNETTNVYEKTTRISILSGDKWRVVDSGQPCKAEITGETCTIVELIK